MPECRVLLVDCCGDEPMLALAEGARVCGEERLLERGAVAGWLPAVKRLLAARGWRLADLDAVGVVGGPGSFTGVRTGVAAAKGLAEAAGLKLAVVSRLRVLAEAAGEPDAVAVLFAGRDQLYVRWPESPEAEETEALAGMVEFQRAAAGSTVVFAEARLGGVPALDGARMVAVRPEHVLRVVQRTLEGGGTPLAEADANYVRAEGEIYRKRAAGPASVPAQEGEA